MTTDHLNIINKHNMLNVCAGYKKKKKSNA